MREIVIDASDPSDRESVTTDTKVVTLAETLSGNLVTLTAAPTMACNVPGL